MILVSACLAGFNCKYNGKNNYNEKTFNLVKEGKAIPVCAEQLGGLTTPRLPSEIKRINGKRYVIQSGHLVFAASVGFAEIFGNNGRSHDSTSPASVRIALITPATLARIEIAITITKRSQRSKGTSTTRRGKYG